MNRPADWLAWSLHFIAGLGLGTGVGWAIVYGRSRHESWWLPDGLAPLFVTGAALIFAGLASYHGDRLWISGYSGMVPPEGIPHDKASRLISIAAVVVGTLLIASTLILFFMGD